MNFPFHKSLRCAIRGIVRCLRNERNMRFHTMAALYVLFFSGFFGLSRAELAVLFVTIGAVLSAEVFNTAAEDLCDYVSPGFARRIGSVKDLAAGAVLLSANGCCGCGSRSVLETGALFCDHGMVFGCAVAFGASGCFSPGGSFVCRTARTRG